MKAPREVVPPSVMPGYPFLAERPLDYGDIADRMSALRLAGVPYTDEMIAKAKADVEAQINPDSKGARELVARYPKAQARKFDGKPDTPATELDALIAYLQMLGTLVDFTSFDAAGPNLR
jgi:cytochrome c oxidase cbb3-type subunit 2